MSAVPARVAASALRTAEQAIRHGVGLAVADAVRRSNDLQLGAGLLENFGLTPAEAHSLGLDGEDMLQIRRASAFRDRSAG